MKLSFTTIRRRCPSSDLCPQTHYCRHPGISITLLHVLALTAWNRHPGYSASQLQHSPHISCILSCVMRPLTHVADGRAGGDDVLPSSEPAFPMSFCFTTEAALDSAQDNIAVEPPRFYNSLRRKRSPGAFARSPRDRQASPSPTIESLASFSSSALDLDLETVSSHTHSQHVTTDLSPPMSGMSSSPSSRRDSSTASSPRRLRRSDAPSCDSRLRAEGAPQLIMPSVVVPQRRPFSEAGKSLGKLKILIAGQQGQWLCEHLSLLLKSKITDYQLGVGKTSLVQSIAQCCQHIVHVDNAISPRPDSMNELYASTRSLPWWRTSMDSASNAGQRRYSTSEILDRNVCFVVRSGYQPHNPVSNHAIQFPPVSPGLT